MKNSLRLDQNYPQITESNRIYDKALDLIPFQTQTIAKGTTQYVKGVAPKYLKSGKGSHVWDVDGNEYLDFNMAIGPLSLGYNIPEINEAIMRQLNEGITFSLMHPTEVELAELLHEVVPNTGSVRYSRGGADVTSAAVRAARAYTGKDRVLCCGYHGWHDWYAATLPLNGGIPDAVKNLTGKFAYNDIDSAKAAIDDNTAAIILEPFIFQAPENNFLQDLRALCDEKGIVLIFDEMWTGFRIALGGAQEYFGVDADMATFSKAIANGMPLSVLTGKKEFMKVFEQNVFFFNTFGGEALSLAAGKATIEFMKKHNVVEHLDKQGKKLKEGYNDIARSLGMDYTDCSGYNCRTIISFDEKAGNPLLQKSILQQEMIKRGILWMGFHNVSYSHSDEDVDYTLKVYEQALPVLKKAVEDGNLEQFLDGEPIQPTFRKTKF
jgi:glutamate-1-semialdehyde aminotransferase